MKIKKLESLLVSWFLIYWPLGSLVSSLQSFKVPKLQGFNKSFNVFWKIFISYYQISISCIWIDIHPIFDISKIIRRSIGMFGPVFSNDFNIFDFQHVEMYLKITLHFLELFGVSWCLRR